MCTAKGMILAINQGKDSELCLVGHDMFILSLSCLDFENSIKMMDFMFSFVYIFVFLSWVSAFDSFVNV